MSFLKKHFRLLIFIFLVLTISFLLLLYYFLMQYYGFGNYTKKFINTDIKFKYDSTSSGQFYVFENNFYFATKDGIKYIDKSGKVIWDEVFNFNYPTLIGEGGYCIVTEERSNKIYVFSQKGLIYEKQFDKQSILFAAINNSGYSVVILEDELGYLVKCFTSEGIGTANVPETSTNVFPISADISNDNRILAISMLDITGIEQVSWLQYYYLNTTESWEKTEGKIERGAKRYHSILPILKFMKDDTLLVFSENEIFGSKEVDKLIFEEKFKIDLDNKITSIFFSEDNYFTLLFGDAFLNHQGDEKYTIKTIDTKGLEISSIKTDMNVNYLSVGYDGLIVGDFMIYKAYDFRNGKKLWEYNSMQNINNLFFFQNTKTLLQISNNEAFIVKYQSVKKEKNDEIFDENSEVN